MGILEKNIKTILEAAYLLLFAVMIGYYFSWTTTFEIVWPEYFYRNLRILLLIVITMRFAAEDKICLADILLGALTAFIFLVAWQHNTYEELSNIVLLIVGSRGISYRKIVKVFLITCSVLLFWTVFSALTGRIENLIIYQDGRRQRISFGIVYPTDFSAHLFYMITAYCCIRKERLRYLEIGGIAAVGIFVYIFCDARLNTICILLVAGCMAFNKWRHRRAQHQYQMHSALSLLLCLSTTICAMVMIGLTLLYDPGSKLMVLFDNILNSRLRLGKKGIDLYGLSIFGQPIKLIGSGNSVKQPENYFFLDSSYLYVLLQYGILVLGVLLLLFAVLSFKARKERQWTLLWLIAVMGLQCVVEHHIMDISYNILLWLPLACLSEEPGKEPIIKRGWRKVKA
ncbi:hypothetical protein [Luxibacter massiliensis]|uniref:hypothetical protein n=1 Tax=Luxibacter massiliensis TaxID=2219695 RepID=UPI000F046D5E|nr:hypothetical protein [Luxibacter massiliensis]